MAPQETLDYPTVCQYVGQVYLETRHQIEQLACKLATAERERDDALRLLARQQERATA
jgi:hypothetical protein